MPATEPDADRGYQGLLSHSHVGSRWQQFTALLRLAATGNAMPLATQSVSCSAYNTGNVLVPAAQDRRDRGYGIILGWLLPFASAVCPKGAGAGGDSSRPRLGEETFRDGHFADDTTTIVEARMMCGCMDVGWDGMGWGWDVANSPSCPVPPGLCCAGHHNSTARRACPA